MDPVSRGERVVSATAAHQQANLAERDIAWVRFAVILFNSFAYLLWVYPAGVPWLALLVIVVAVPYGLAVPVLRLHDRIPALRAAETTAVLDGILIVAWLLATGGGSSPFYLLWFLSILAVGSRFDWRTTLLTTWAYAGIQGVFLMAEGRLVPEDPAALAQPVYILLVGALAALMGRQVNAQLRARIEATRAMVRVESERRVHEQEREIERMHELEQFRRRLLNATSHELNTPLTPLKLQLNLLSSGRAGPLTEQQQRSVAVLDRNVDRLAELVGDVLDVARMQSDRLGVKPEPMDLMEILEPVREAFEEAFLSKGLTLRIDGPGPVWVRADARRVEQVLSNLFSNALKFTAKGGARVVVSRRGGEAVVKVKDSGIGLDESQMAELFEPFSRVHDEKMITATGTGLGLYICRGLIEAQGGRLDCSSDGPGQGSTFTFTLPLVEGAQP